MGPTRVLIADRGDAGRRLDLVLRRHLTDVTSASRTRVQQWIAKGCVTVNGMPVRRTAARAALGDVVTVALPRQARLAPMAAEDIGLDVLYEDDHLLAIDKPAGRVVHPAYKNTAGTVMNALLWHAREWPPRLRPSIVGRLDKLTSGVVVVAKTAATHAALQRAMTSANSEKDYLAVVYGRVNAARGTIDLRLGLDRRDRRRMVASADEGLPSMTLWVRLARVAAPSIGLSLLRCRLLTGRRHQIRVHLAARGWPIVGDPVYGVSSESVSQVGVERLRPCPSATRFQALRTWASASGGGAPRESKKSRSRGSESTTPPWSRIIDPALAATLRAFPRQALHCWRVGFIHPVTRARTLIEAPLPDDFERLLASSGLISRRSQLSAFSGQLSAGRTG